jgi:beta-glucanase (GH16 family)
MKYRSTIIAAALWLPALCPGSAADSLYAEDFDRDPGYVGAKGPNDNNISSISYGAPGSSAPRITNGQFGGTSQYLSDTKTPGSTAKGALALGSHPDLIHGKSRSRSYLTVIDTSDAEAGQYRVSFDVGDFQSAGENAPLYFHLFEGGTTDKGYVDFLVTHQTDLPDLAPTMPIITTGQGATAERVLVENQIKGNGKFDLSFGLTESGDPGDYLALVWTQVKTKGSAPIPSMTIDNVSVSRIPVQPAATNSGAKSLPAPLGPAGSWDLVDEVSDEFESAVINPQKWNNNPASWGAWSWDEKNAFLKSGKLHLQMVHEPHQRNRTNLFYKSGIVRSHRQMTYGYYEARIKGCQLFPGACPAFWSYSDGRKYSGVVRYCEVDFVEIGMNELNPASGQRNPVEHLDMNLHLRLADANGEVRWLRPNMDPDLCASSWIAPWDPRDDFHVYGCEIGEETITWFIDGKEVAQKPNKHWHLPMNITLSLGLRHPHIGWVGQDMKPVPQAATATGFPTAMEVDYVRVWTRKP